MAHRPKRGAAGPDIEIGDPFGQYEYQGGAAPGASESGDLQSREFGVPQADIPGGLNHLVNTEAHPVKPPKTPQQQPVINDHGVPPVDGTQYEFPGKADKQGHQPKPAPEPHLSEAVPVYLTEGPGKERRIRSFLGGQRRNLLATAADGAVRVADCDPHRKSVWITNENGTRTNYVLVGGREQSEESVDMITTAGSSASYPMLSIPGGTGPVEIDTQDQLFVVNPQGGSVVVSWGYLTEIRATEP